MTDEQRKFVEDNFNLIFSYIHQKKLNESDYFGPLQEALCVASYNWVPDMCAASTYIFKQFDWAVKHVHTYNNRKARKYEGDLVSFDAFWTNSYSDEDKEDFESMLNAQIFQGQDSIEAMCEREDIRRWYSNLSEKDKQIIVAAYRHNTQSDAARSLGVSRQYINLKLQEMKQNFKIAVGDNYCVGSNRFSHMTPEEYLKLTNYIYYKRDLNRHHKKN